MTATKTFYKAIMQKAQTVLAAVTGIENVWLPERIESKMLTKVNLPGVIIEPGEAERQIEEVADPNEPRWWKIQFNTLLIVRDHEPSDWITEIVDVLGDMVDAIEADTTLNSRSTLCWCTFFSPAQINIQNKLYWGGIATFSYLGQQLTA